MTTMAETHPTARGPGEPASRDELPGRAGAPEPRTVLIDILHPAHVHFFRPIREELLRRGCRVLVTAREKEMSLRLLDAYGIPHAVISRQRRGAGLVAEMVSRTTRLMGICRRERPSLLLGIMGPSIAVGGRLLGIPAWVFYDTENAWITNWFAYPLAQRVYTPECYQGRRRRNQILYPGYHELSYLHPSRFAPDRLVPARYGIDMSRPYFVVRFVGWQASHDVGERGLSLDQKRALVADLSERGAVYISSESPLPEDLRARALPCRDEDAHHVLAFARLVVGESATMASEAAVIGVPAVYISDTGRGYTDEEERRYGLVKNFTTREFARAVECITSLCADPESPERARAARQRLLAEKTDVAGYVADEVITALGGGGDGLTCGTTGERHS